MRCRPPRRRSPHSRRRAVARRHAEHADRDAGARRRHQPPRRASTASKRRRPNVVTPALVRQADALTSPVIRSNVPLLAMALPHVGHYPDAQSRYALRLGRACRSERGNAAGAGDARWRGRAEIREAHAQREGARLLSRRAHHSARTGRDAGRAALAAAKTPHADSFREFSIREGDFACGRGGLCDRLRAR